MKRYYVFASLMNRTKIALAFLATLLVALHSPPARAADEFRLGFPITMALQVEYEAGMASDPARAAYCRSEAQFMENWRSLYLSDPIAALRKANAPALADVKEWADQTVRAIAACGNGDESAMLLHARAKDAALERVAAQLSISLDYYRAKATLAAYVQADPQYGYRRALELIETLYPHVYAKHYKPKDKEPSRPASPPPWWEQPG